MLLLLLEESELTLGGGTSSVVGGLGRGLQSEGRDKGEIGGGENLASKGIRDRCTSKTLRSVIMP